jgi:hypothetical protein
MTDQIEITLDVDDVGEIPDDLYYYLCDQFVAKAKSQGIDLVGKPALCLTDWTIKARVESV